MLAKGKIQAEHGESGLSKGLANGHQNRGLRVTCGAVGQNQAVARGSFGNVHESPDRRIDSGLGEFADGCGQQNIVNR